MSKYHDKQQHPNEHHYWPTFRLRILYQVSVKLDYSNKSGQWLKARPQRIMADKQEAYQEQLEEGDSIHRKLATK